MFWIHPGRWVSTAPGKHQPSLERLFRTCRRVAMKRHGLARFPQGLLFWLFKRCFKGSSDTASKYRRSYGTDFDSSEIASSVPALATTHRSLNHDLEWHLTLARWLTIPMRRSVGCPKVSLDSSGHSR